MDIKNRTGRTVAYGPINIRGILSQNQAVDLTSFQKTMDAIAPVLGVISTITTIVDIVSLACGATGFLSWVSVIVDVVGGLTTLVLSCTSNNSKDGTSINYHNLDLNATSPLPTQFKRSRSSKGRGPMGERYRSLPTTPIILSGL